MVITPEKKQEIEKEIAKFLRHLMTEKKERLDIIDIVDVKNFDLSMHPKPISISPR